MPKLIGTAPVKLPQKQREESTRLTDSTIWNNFKFHEGDVVLASYPKSGTHWAQQILTQLIWEGEEAFDKAMPMLLDFRPIPQVMGVSREQLLARVDSVTHRRCISTHLPADALVFSEKAKYVVVCRDGRDVAWSLHTFMSRFSPSFVEMANSLPGVDAPLVKQADAADVVGFYKEFLKNNGHPVTGPQYFHHVRSYWELQHLPNVYLLHYNNLKKNLRGEIQKLAGFLGIDVNESMMGRIMEHCSFDYMKQNEAKLNPHVGKFLAQGGGLVNKGTIGRWGELLSEADVKEYEEMAQSNLGKECAHWLATGEKLA